MSNSVLMLLLVITFCVMVTVLLDAITHVYKQVNREIPSGRFILISAFVTVSLSFLLCYWIYSVAS